MKQYALSIGALLFAVPVFAQGTAAPVSAVGTTRTIWEQYASYNLRSAEQVAEADYAYKPVSTVRSFGQLIGHIAGAQYMFCAMALGEKIPDEGAVEESAKSKAELVAALKASTEYCNRAYALSPAELDAPVTIFGQESTRMGALVMNSNHNGEHYGNMVVYLRLNGIVPPSSRRGM